MKWSETLSMTGVPLRSTSQLVLEVHFQRAQPNAGRREMVAWAYASILQVDFRDLDCGFTLCGPLLSCKIPEEGFPERCSTLRGGL